ncbi:nucleotidyl transferase AbiEii/AbiGii toxin family protein [Gemmatimonadota bacterium]
MSFPHRDPEFANLISIVAAKTGLGEAIIEKDYWVTHTLWALHQLPLEIWFKGGTSLSKGFGLISRFSEDIDLRIEPGSETPLSRITNWKSKNAGVVRKRRDYFDALLHILDIPDATGIASQIGFDDQARGALYLIEYPGAFQHLLPDGLRPYIQLEVGYARVEPSVERPLSSFIHDWLEDAGQLDAFRDNRPRQVLCVHPIVTLIEKIDAIIRRYPREPFDPAPFVRHYEDAANIIDAISELPPLSTPVSSLLAEMLEERQIHRLPVADESAFLLDDHSRLQVLNRHYKSIAPMFWNKRRNLESACSTILGWIRSTI